MIEKRPCGLRLVARGGKVPCSGERDDELLSMMRMCSTETDLVYVLREGVARSLN